MCKVWQEETLMQLHGEKCPALSDVYHKKGHFKTYGLPKTVATVETPDMYIQ